MSPDEMVKGKRYEVTYQIPSLHRKPRKMVANFGQRVSYSTHHEYDFLVRDDYVISMDASWMLKIVEVDGDTLFCYGLMARSS